MNFPPTRGKLWFPMHNIKREGLSWGGDNRKFVVETWLPSEPRLSPRSKEVIRWAYGYDGCPKSYEQESNGSSVVPDQFLGGLIKEPWGVAHDMLCTLFWQGKPTPDKHLWTWNEAACWYANCVKEAGYPVRAAIRLFGLWLRGLFIFPR